MIQWSFIVIIFNIILTYYIKTQNILIHPWNLAGYKNNKLFISNTVGIIIPEH